MKNKLLAALLCAGLMFILLPQAVQAAGDYTYIDENGNTKTTEGLTVTPVTVDTGTLNSGWYVVNSNITRTGTFTVSGSVNLILMDGFTLTVTGDVNNAGINVSPGNSLTVYGQAGGTGAVIAQGGQYGAGIGGGNWSSGGTFFIYGGTVSATGGESAAGIGGGKGVMGSDNSSGGTINISGGSVTATGNGYGAGIGGGLQGGGGMTTISGGTVNATGGRFAAGIGGGGGKSGGTTTISGGTVIANSTGSGAGIGGGGGSYCSGGTITISGGTVSASSTSSGAGIGGGRINSDGGDITISGGTITATGGESGAGIGGSQNGSGGNIKIQDGNITATGGRWGAGIGGGSGASAGDITISGGVVKAYAGDYATGVYSGSAGIGAGGTNSANTHNGGNIKILGGKVTAGGAYSSLDIGRGRNGVNGTLLIDDTAQVTLAANGIDSSATTLGTCILEGSAAGALLGAYENGIIIDGTLIDMSASSLPGGTGYTVSGDTVTLTGGSGSSYVLFNSTASRNIVVSSGSSVNVTLFTADIRPASGCAFNMAGATVNLRLVAANTLSSNDGYAGLQASTGSSLTVNGSGSLTATGGNDGAGIGGGSGVSAGSITFSGGTVETAGNGGGAGIGGGSGGAGGAVIADGANTAVTVTGGTGFDIGSGSGNSTGGTLTMKNNAAVNLNRNGTNANTSFITGTVGGDGAGLSAGTYLDSHKLLSLTSFTASPESGVIAFDSITLTANITGLSEINAQGQIGFYDNGTKIGQASLTRLAAGSADATAAFIWTASEGTHILTAQYVQNETADSYYMTDTGELDSIIVNKATPPTVVFPSAGAITYGQQLSASVLIGGSGDGNFAWENPAAIPTVINSGYTVVFTPDDTDNYDYTGFTLYQTVAITVNKANPVVTFPTAGEITYEQPLSASALTGGSGDGSFAWESPATVPTVVNSGYNVVFTPDDIDNYNTVSQTVLISVLKAEQAALVVDGIPDTLTYGNLPFDLLGRGGSGTGSFSYEVTSGDAVSVSASGTVTVLKVGTAGITATKSGDSNYLSASTDVPISVNKAVPTYTITFGATLPGTGYTVIAEAGSSSPVTSGGSFSFTVAIAGGYHKGAGFAVKANGTTLTANGSGVYTISDITQNQAITVEGVVQDTPASGSGCTPPVDTTVYNDPIKPSATIWLSGSGLAGDDLLVTETITNGVNYNAMLKLADKDDIFRVYNISLKSGKTSTGSAMYLTLDLTEKYTGQAFTLVHKKADGTFEYLYATADVDGKVKFGPVYELSPFMLVKGQLLNTPTVEVVNIPQTGDASNPLPFALLALAALCGMGATVYREKRTQAKHF